MDLRRRSRRDDWFFWPTPNRGASIVITHIYCMPMFSPRQGTSVRRFHHPIEAVWSRPPAPRLPPPPFSKHRVTVRRGHDGKGGKKKTMPTCLERPRPREQAASPRVGSCRPLSVEAATLDEKKSRFSTVIDRSSPTHVSVTCAHAPFFFLGAHCVCRKVALAPLFFSKPFL